MVRHVFVSTLVLLLIIPNVMGSGGQSWSDPAGDVVASLSGIRMPPEADCYDGRVDWTALAIEVVDETLRVTFSFADIHGAPACDLPPLNSLRPSYFDVALVIGEAFGPHRHWLEIYRPGGGWAGIDGWFGAVHVTDDMTVSIDGNTVVLEGPVRLWGYDGQVREVDIRGWTFDDASAWAVSYGDTDIPRVSVRFQDGINIGPVTL